MSTQHAQLAVPILSLGGVSLAGLLLCAQPAGPGGGEIVTPAEITIHSTPAGPVFADPQSYSLYVTERDTEPGTSTCVGPCTAEWPPVRTSADATPFGDWTLVPRGDGASQWAYQGRPLYRYRREARTGWAEAQSRVWLLATTSPFPVRGTRLRYGQRSEVPKTRLAVSGVPGGIVGQVTPLGAVLADWNGMTLYTRSSPDACVDECLETWIPLAAPMAAFPIDEWTLVTRPDGSRQWAFRGLGLYRCTKDKSPGDTRCESIAAGGHTVRPPEEASK